VANEDVGATLILHAKLLVLGRLKWLEDSDFVGEEHRFIPESLWWGSANWTQLSRKHLEVGFWSDDSGLVNEAFEFVAALIAFSEPLGAETAGPEPEYQPVDFDDDAMRAAQDEPLDDQDDDW
jgi:hypothetical protein